MSNGQCRHCGGNALEFLVATDRNQRISTENFCFLRCTRCAVVFLRDIPDDLGRYYPDKYYAVPLSEDELARRSEPEQYRIELVQQYSDSGRLLEIGPSYGLFSHLAKEAGFEVDVIEMDARCCQFLSEVVGVNVTQSERPHEVLQGTGPYDVVVMQHVIEHLTEPWSCLRQVAAELAPGGILCISTPNPEALQFMILRSRWVHLDAPRHLQLIPASLLIERLSEWGLEPLMITCNDQGGRECNRGGWIASITHVVAQPTARRWLWRIGRLAYWVVGAIVEPFERADLKGSAYTLVVQKGGGAD